MVTVLRKVMTTLSLGTVPMVGLKQEMPKAFLVEGIRLEGYSESCFVTIAGGHGSLRA